MYKNPLLWSDNIMKGCESRPRQNSGTNGHASTEDKERASVVPRYIKLPGYVLPMTAELCETLHRLTSIKADWTWNRTYQDIFVKVKTIVKRDVCMMFYDAARFLYLDASGTSLGTRLLQVGGRMNVGMTNTR